MMASIRKTLENNVNGSKNTRMDVEHAIGRFDIRKDELMHMNRYLKAGDTIVKLAKALGRPLRVLDIGCGEIYVARTFFSSFVERKADNIERYVGVDIDQKNIDKCHEKYEKLMKTMNAELVCIDMTTESLEAYEDGYFDLIVNFEMIEHIQPRFLKKLFTEMSRVLSDDGILLLSTPNADGSSPKLPKDHIYEYPFAELSKKLRTFFVVKNMTGMSVNLSKIPEGSKHLIEMYHGFGKTFASVAIAPMIEPVYCKNILWECRK